MTYLSVQSHALEHASKSTLAQSELVTLAERFRYRLQHSFILLRVRFLHLLRDRNIVFEIDDCMLPCSESFEK